MNAATRELVRQARLITATQQYHYHIAWPAFVFNTDRSADAYPTEQEAKQAIRRLATQYKRLGYPIELRGQNVSIAGSTLGTAACKQSH